MYKKTPGQTVNRKARQRLEPRIWREEARQRQLAEHDPGPSNALCGADVLPMLKQRCRGKSSDLRIGKHELSFKALKELVHALAGGQRRRHGGRTRRSHPRRVAESWPKQPDTSHNASRQTRTCHENRLFKAWEAASAGRQISESASKDNHTLNFCFLAQRV